MARFTSIPTERRESPMMPRINKIRLGIRKKNQAGKEFPGEVDYFVLSDCPEVEEVYGKSPKQLPVLFPVEDPSVIMPYRYAKWGSDKGLLCQGDGRTCLRNVLNEETGEVEQVEGECPGPEDCEFACTKGDGTPVKKPLCIRQGTLNFILPGVSMGGVYQIDTTAWHSINQIHDHLEYIRSMCGRVSWLMLGEKCLIYLVRKPKETHGSGRKEVHWPMQLELRATPQEVIMIRKKAVEMAAARQLTAEQTTALATQTAPDDLLPAGHWQNAKPEQEPQRPKRVASTQTAPTKPLAPAASRPETDPQGPLPAEPTEETAPPPRIGAAQHPDEGPAAPADDGEDFFSMDGNL